MIQQSHAPMDIGEVEGEASGSDDQIDAKRRKVNTPRRTREAALEKRRHRDGKRSER